MIGLRQVVSEPLPNPQVADLPLARRIWRRYGRAPGVISTDLAAGLAGRGSRFGAPGLAGEIFARWAPSAGEAAFPALPLRGPAVMDHPSWPGAPLAAAVSGRGGGMAPPTPVARVVQRTPSGAVAAAVGANVVAQQSHPANSLGAPASSPALFSPSLPAGEDASAPREDGETIHKLAPMGAAEGERRVATATERRPAVPAPAWSAPAPSGERSPLPPWQTERPILIFVLMFMGPLIARIPVSAKCTLPCFYLPLC